MLNFRQEPNNIAVVIGASKPAGVPILIGDALVVIPESASNAANDAVNCKTEGVFDIAVTGANGSGNTAIVIGDNVCLDGGVVNVDDTNGVIFGRALEAAATTVATVIRVLVK